MRNWGTERKHPQARSAGTKLSYTPRDTMQPARTRLQVDVRRQQLLDLGLELFGNQTYDELSIDEIATRAGVSKGLLYHYFPSKRAFYVAAVREAARQLLEETDVDQHGRGPTPDPEGVRAGLRAFLGYVARRRVAYGFLLRGGIGTDPEVARIIEDTRQALVDRMISRLSRFGAQQDDPATRLRLRGWLGFLEASSLEWVERQELDLETFLQLLVQMSSVVFASVLPLSEQ
jgi:AcrR family transcriptional regulator